MNWPFQRRPFLVIDNDGREPILTVRDLLNTLLETAISATQATGGAIALTVGAEIVCCASQGTAPDVGTHFVMSSWGFSARCVRKSRMLLCVDAELHHDYNPGASVRLAVV